MASGSSASSMLFFGTTGTADNMEVMMNSQQDLNTMLPNSWFSAQHNHQIVAPKEQDPADAQIVISVSPTTLVDPNRFVCEVCYKGFSRKQNLTLHRRTHNLPFLLKTNKPKGPAPRKVYLCPEPTCAHHEASHALGDFGGLKKHYLRKHCTDRKYKCDTCTKAYTVETDLKSHQKVCGKKKYACVCGSRFSRGFSIAIHQENCEAQGNKGADNHSQELDMEDTSVKNTNSNNIISSTNPHPPTSALISPQFSSMFNSYPSITPQSRRRGTDHESLKLFPNSMANIVPPPLFSQSSTQQNQLEFQENSDIGLYADLLMDNIRLETMIPNYMGDGGDIYGRSLSLTPAMHNTNFNGMFNPVSGSGVQSSTINRDVGASYQPSYYGYGYGSGFGYGSGMEVFGYETSAAAGAGSGAEAGAGAGAETGAPVVDQYLNPYGFWF